MLKKVVLLLILVFLARVSSLKADEIGRQPKKGTIIAGSCLLGTSYLIFTFAGLSVPGAESIAIPFVGPFVQIAKEQPPSPGVFLYSSMALTEMLGLALIIRGIIGEKPKQSLKVLPFLSPKGGGCWVTFSLPSK